MSKEKLVSALVAFVLGLLAKFIYDVWEERRKRKQIVLKKSVISKFNPNELEEGIRESTQVLYQGRNINSIQIVHVEVENKSASALRNQAITVRFSDQAQILNVEQDSETTSEDLRYVALDPQTESHKKRYILQLLRKDSHIGWNFTVINHRASDFVVEHGVASTEAKKTDLDVETLITADKTQLDLVERIYRMASLLIGIRILSLLRESIPTPVFSDLLRPLFNILVIGIWILIVRELGSFLKPLFRWLEGKETRGSWYVEGTHHEFVVMNESHLEAIYFRGSDTSTDGQVTPDLPD